MKTQRLFLFTFFFITIALVFFPIANVLAQKATPSDDEVNAIARKLFCPICENTPLDVCPTDACRDWRELIRQMLAQGKTTNEINQYFVDHYGARVLSEPPLAGFLWLVYIVPPLAFLIGLVFLFRAFRTWRKVPKETTPSEITKEKPPVEDKYASQLEDELNKRR